MTCSQPEESSESFEILEEAVAATTRARSTPVWAEVVARFPVEEVYEQVEGTSR